MKVSLPPGKYVIAVSGGVDSMVLLDVLSHLPGVELTVAHFEHGIRIDSDEDRQLVEEAAKKYGLPFVYEHGHLGAHVSESAARTARYAFLRRVQEAVHAQAIITAHHQDDLLETVVLNLLRGTGRKGLAPLKSQSDIVRPFIHICKTDILAYAKRHHIQWHEDSTNADETYTRNYIRRSILPRLTTEEKQTLLTHIEQAEKTNRDIDAALDTLLKPTADRLPRKWFILLPHTVAREVMAAWLRAHEYRDFDRKDIERLVTAAKVANLGKTADISRELVLYIGKDFLEIRKRPLS